MKRNVRTIYREDGSGPIAVPHKNGTRERWHYWTVAVHAYPSPVYPHSTTYVVELTSHSGDDDGYFQVRRLIDVDTDSAAIRMGIKAFDETNPMNVEASRCAASNA